MRVKDFLMISVLNIAVKQSKEFGDDSFGVNHGSLGR